jgi:regulator of protease activity HflC (stomatin/prohibitin superfamily)
MEAEQEAERAKINAAAEAEVAKIAAQADLEVTKIQADAAEYAGLKEAAKNKAISEQLTDLLLQYYYVQQWNGVVPESYVGSDNVSAIIGMGGR